MLGGALDLDEIAGTGHGHVHVGHGLAVFDVRQVQHRLAVDHADGDGGDPVLEHAVGGLDVLVFLGPMHRVDERHVRAGDRSGAGAAVGLQHVAVDLHLVFAERLHIDDATQAAADQTADLVRTAADLAAHGLAVGAVGGGARQHRVFRGDPAQAGVLAPARHAGGERGGAHHARVAAFDEHGAFRNVREMAGDAHRAQFVDLASVRTHHGLVAQHILNRYHCCSALRFPLISAFAAVRLLVFSAFDPITSQARRASRPLLHV
ncbi:hypothetical protein BAD_0229 [Bifidobacterium adolescentis ATCC 15703]|uniref:Uncharacterized protein n=1 Tax=Bifidobacterium adolescentis (strain ATCC 15703 / DSM 20083 / NCTC 11814 / E194a) TaxID=367928 RepID=A0ZZX7_BIFAA|nr:hypothetical protein BAD_0229 [Bifidobacterium adolescentis ATCC 15703]